jgi:hypothetical protein
MMKSNKPMKTPICFLFTLLCAVITSLHSVHAAAINVNSTADPTEIGKTTLRDALNVARDGDTINFSVSGTISLARDGFIVRKSISIHGPGAANLAIKGARSAVFFVSSNLTVTISGLTIRNGASQDGGGIINEGSTLRVLFCVLSNNKAVGGNGGAIANSGHNRQRATLIVSGCTFSNNSAWTGGAISNDGFGDATTSVTFSTFDHNTAMQEGGAII